MTDAGELKIFKVLNLGAGVQSSAMLLMCCHGVLPKPDVVIFADTQCERTYTYDWLKTLEEEASEAGMEIHRTTAGNMELDCYARIEGTRKSYANPPFFNTNKQGELGRIHKQCTRDYKIYPVERLIKKLCGLQPRSHWPKDIKVEQWIGFTTDERKRCQPSLKQWNYTVWPLIEDLDMSRQNCITWLEEHGYPVPVRSSCFFCPNRRNEEWLVMKVKYPDEFDKACAFDERIRSGIPYMDSEVFLHRSLKPLRDVDFYMADQFEFMGCEVCGI